MSIDIKMTMEYFRCACFCFLSYYCCEWMEVARDDGVSGRMLSLAVMDSINVLFEQNK